jgi:hypothetical protein
MKWLDGSSADHRVHFGTCAGGAGLAAGSFIDKWSMTGQGNTSGIDAVV